MHIITPAPLNIFPVFFVLAGHYSILFWLSLGCSNSVACAGIELPVGSSDDRTTANGGMYKR